MTTPEPTSRGSVAVRRLVAQRLAGPAHASAPDAVRSLLAVQSQDYAGAKWALGQRVAGATETDIDRAFDAGEIVRTHVMRPTWHFVAPEDLRWLLALTAPRVHQASAYQYRLLEIDDEVARAAAEVFRRVLGGGVALTRNELGRALNDAGIPGSGMRLGYLMAHAELEAIVCSGPRRGRQQTYALVDERVPPGPVLPREQALAEIARRYVEGHGPAQAIDLSWWSGLTLRDARLALEAATPPLMRETVSERQFYVAPGSIDGSLAGLGELPGEPSPRVHLLPNYDELLIAFRDRSDAMDPGLPPPARVAAEILNHVIVREGLGVGGWRRTDDGRRLRVELNPLVPLTAEERDEVRNALDRLSRFLAKPVEASGLD